MKKICLTLFFLLVISLSCTHKQHGLPVKTTELQFNISESYPIASLIDSIQYIPIQYDIDNYFKHIDKIMTNEDNIFILDIHGQNKILAFDKTGKFKYQVGRQGKGPGEYVRIRNFTIDDNYIYIIDNDKQQLLKHGIADGKYVDHITLPVIALDMVAFTNGDYMFASAPLMQGATLAIDQPNYKLFVTNNQGEITNRLLPFSENDCAELSRASFFTQVQDSIVFNSSISDTIIVMSKNSPGDYHAYAVDLGRNKIPDDQRNNLDQIYNYDYIDATPFLYDNYLIGTINRPDNDGAYIYDLTDKRLYLNSISGDASNYLLPPLGMYQNKVLTLCESYDILYSWLITNGFTKAPASIEKAMIEGDPVLILYSLLSRNSMVTRSAGSKCTK